MSSLKLAFPPAGQRGLTLCASSTRGSSGRSSPRRRRRRPAGRAGRPGPAGASPGHLVLAAARRLPAVRHPRPHSSPLRRRGRLGAEYDARRRAAPAARARTVRLLSPRSACVHGGARQQRTQRTQESPPSPRRRRRRRRGSCITGRHRRRFLLHFLEKEKAIGEHPMPALSRESRIT